MSLHQTKQVQGSAREPGCVPEQRVLRNSSMASTKQGPHILWFHFLVSDKAWVTDTSWVVILPVRIKQNLT